MQVETRGSHVPVDLGMIEPSFVWELLAGSISDSPVCGGILQSAQEDSNLWPGDYLAELRLQRLWTAAIDVRDARFHCWCGPPTDSGELI